MLTLLYKATVPEKTEKYSHLLFSMKTLHFTVKDDFSSVPQILWVVAELMTHNRFGFLITKITTNKIEKDTGKAECSPTSVHLWGSFLILLILTKLF